MSIKNRNLRAAQARQRPDEKPVARAETDTAGEQITQIDRLSRNARNVWFGLLSYLAFVGVTLMG